MTSPSDAGAAIHHGHGNVNSLPPLPPRPLSATHSARTDSSLTAMTAHDPRSSSTQSLVPDIASNDTSRRRLLLVYIHGFMGDETSFQSFPAHVHNLLTITLTDSHVVHSKIYPKYKSRYSLDVARDDFSKWLSPHESPSTDVVLLGHSMGGLVAADIALLFQHNIIGIVSFDAPFIGMHPGIVKAGLGSIFKPAPPPQHQIAEEAEAVGKRPSRINTLFNPRPSDPNFNPSFYNDIHLPVRKGWENTLHFITKHSNGLIQASKGLVRSHLEFGGAMADYPTLKNRYAKIRALEEDDERKRRSANSGFPSPPRIRFVNYYTASTGRPKKTKSPSRSRPASRGLDQTMNDTAVALNSQLTLSTKPIETSIINPGISVEEHRGNEVIPVSPEEPLSATSTTHDLTSRSISPENDSGPALPEIPPIPQEPPFVDLTQYPDKAERKMAEKERERQLKVYQKAVKSRDAVVKERTKIEEKWKTYGKADKSVKEKINSGHDTDQFNEDSRTIQLGDQYRFYDRKDNSPYSSYNFSRSRILAQPHPDDHSSISESNTDSSTTLNTIDTNNTTPESSTSSPSKKKRYKKFCMLPPKDSNGNKDPTWIRVFMEDMDEVTAHTSLFFMSETYERLVGDVAARIEEWVREAQTMRLVRELGGVHH
ncbi:hypothetical protein CC78DRAFT_588495 [Lojkania enalia]|uniref:AB hydrolase-1 domain-containing protein n=1 Tax=Lojkania enalia TaxID=147567 RepID=A0A9P4K0Z9_9PLEO|nr:hypothetical protein CC78DRAFT_588495 [Didymosphaeria enalia]